MSLDLTKLEKLVELAGGAKRARCPACAEAGQDRSGEHLRIYPDGKFGCCVFPGDREHRKRIFSLAGDRSQRGIQVRFTAGTGGGPARTGILRRLGRSFGTGTPEVRSSDGADGSGPVQPKPVEVRTPRTGETNSGQQVMDYSRTARTPLSLVTRGVKGTDGTGESGRVQIESAEGVRSVREERKKEPHLLADGTLVIPFDSPLRFHWWKGGQSIQETRAELLRATEGKECHGGTI